MSNEPLRTRRTFDEAFKRDAVALLLNGGKSAKQLAQDLGVSTWNLRDWRRLQQDGNPAAAAELLPTLLLSVNAIASGLRTTG